MSYRLPARMHYPPDLLDVLLVAEDPSKTLFLIVDVQTSGIKGPITTHTLQNKSGYNVKLNCHDKKAVCFIGKHRHVNVQNVESP